MKSTTLFDPETKKYTTMYYPTDTLKIDVCTAQVQIAFNEWKNYADNILWILQWVTHLDTALKIIKKNLPQATRADGMTMSDFYTRTCEALKK